jgi:hypothetical protein
VAEGYYLIRDLDLLPEILHAEELMEGIEDARMAATSRRAANP